MCVCVGPRVNVRCTAQTDWRAVDEEEREDVDDELWEEEDDGEDEEERVGVSVGQGCHI